MAQRKKTQDTPPRLIDLVEQEAADRLLSGQNRAVILAMRDEIEEVLARGYNWKVVWTALTNAERIDMSYDTFRAHCRAAGLERAPTSTKPRRKKPTSDQ